MTHNERLCDPENIWQEQTSLCGPLKERRERLIGSVPPTQIVGAGEGMRAADTAHATPLNYPNPL